MGECIKLKCLSLAIGGASGGVWIINSSHCYCCCYWCCCILKLWNLFGCLNSQQTVLQDTFKTTTTTTMFSNINDHNFCVTKCVGVSLPLCAVDLWKSFQRQNKHYGSVRSVLCYGSVQTLFSLNIFIHERQNGQNEQNVQSGISI